MKRYIVKTAAAAMPNKCWGTYRRVAVIEVAEGVDDVAIISERARGVVRIVTTWEKCNVGKTAASCYHRALAAAQALADSLNAEVSQ